MVGKSKIIGIAIITVLLVSLLVSLAAAQLITEKTTNVTIAPNGTFTATDSDCGVSYSIVGAPGATGTVTACVYNCNPQLTAVIPRGTSLNHFVAITFNMGADGFQTATITVGYTASDVQNIRSPYEIFKYVPDTNSYVKLNSTVNTVAKTITVKSNNSLNESLLAIGGATASTLAGGIAASTWVILTISVSAIVLLSVVAVKLARSWENAFFKFFRLRAKVSC